MHKSLFRWRMRLILTLLCLLLAFNVAGIQAQDVSPTPETPAVEPTEPTAPPALPSEEPTETTPTEVIPTEAPTEVPTETPVPTETVTEPPVVTEVPTETEPPVTETPVVGETPAPVAWSILAREQFNIADLSAWVPGAGWSVVISSPVDPSYPVNAPDVDQALQVVNSNEPIQFGTFAYGNVSVEASLLAAAGSAQISIRQSATDPNANYTAAIDATGLVQLYRSGIAVAPPVQAAATQDNWHVLQLSAYGNVVALTVDRTQTVSWTDPEPLAAGFITLSGEFGDTAAAVDPAANVVKADNFFVYVPDAEKVLYPTPTPATPVATEAPTETPVEIVPTEEVTAAPTEPPTVGGKSLEPYAPPTEEQLIGALASTNDLFANAKLIALSGGFYVDTGSTTADTTEASETQLCGFNIAKTVWYELQVSAAGSYTFSTVGSNFDTIISVYKGPNIPGLTPGGASAIASCNDDINATTNWQSQLTVSLAAGTYKIQVGGYNGAWGNYAFRVQQGAIAAPAAPVLTGPTTGIVLNDNTPTLNWNAPVANAHSYEIQIATLASFTPASLLGSFPSGVGITTFTPAPGLITTPGTYYWRVRAVNINGLAGAYSAVRNVVYRTDPPSLKLPANNAVSTNSKPALSWMTYGAGATYTVQIDDDPGFGSPLNSPTFFAPTPATALTFTPATSLVQGDWYWRVRATDVQGNATGYSESRKITIAISSLPANNAVVPLAGVATTANVKFTWIGVAGATGYSVIVDDDINFGTPLTPITPAVPTALTVTTALPPGVYYWFVQPTVFEPGTPPDASIVRKFTVTPPIPAAPVLVAPAAAAITNDVTPYLDWNDTITSAGGPFTYEVQVCTAATCANVVASDLGSPDTDFTPTALSAGTYFWRVRTVNDFGVPSAYSAARNFVVKPEFLSTPADNAVSALTTPTFAWTAINYPTTPPVYLLEIATALPFDANITLSKPGLTTLNYKLAAGEALANGDYYWRVTANGESTTPRRIIISPSKPAAPTYPATPATNSTFADTTPLLDFNDVVPVGTAPAIDGYEVQIATNAAFTQNLQTITDLGTSQYQVPSGLAEGKYYWRAFAVNEFGALSNPGAARIFNIRTTPPTVTTPLDNAFLNTSKPVFKWPTFGIGAKYRIQIDNNSNFSSPEVNVTDIAALTFTPPTSLTQGVWYWRLAAKDALGVESAFSTSRTFTLRIQNAPADNAVVTLAGAATTANVNFTWITVPGASGYTVMVDDNPAFSSPTPYTPTATLGLSRSVALTADEYWWYVVPTGFAPTDPPPAAIVRKVTVSPAAPAVPVLLLPAPGGATTDTTPTFTWNATTSSAGGPFTYEIQVATASTFAPATLVALTPTTTGLGLTYTPTSALAPGTYFWRVRTVNQFNVTSAFSAATRSFIVDTVGTPLPVLTAPINKSTSTNKTPSFTWTKPTGAVRFELRYSNNYPAGYESGDILDTDGTVIIGNATLSPTTPLLTATTYKNPSPLLPNRYYWQVQAFDAAGNGSGWSDLFTFEITSALSDTPIPNHYGPGDDILLTWGPLSWVCSGGTPPCSLSYYEVQIDNNSNFASPEYQLTNAVGNTVTYTEYINGPYGVEIPDSSTPGGLANGTWYWRVRGFNPTVGTSGAYGAYSSTGTFTVEK